MAIWNLEDQRWGNEIVRLGRIHAKEAEQRKTWIGTGGFYELVSASTNP